MIVRDSGLNIVKACHDMKVPHISCIGHLFHLILAPLCIEPKKNKKKNSSTEPMVDDNFASASEQHSLATNTKAAT
jgi:hypothetical protein